MVVFGKQDSAESIEKINNLSSYPLTTSENERKGDDTLSNREDSSKPKIEPEPINIAFRYEPPPLKQSRSQNRIQIVVRIDFVFEGKNNFYFHF
jgi:hypothetical protein